MSQSLVHDEPLGVETRHLHNELGGEPRGGGDLPSDVPKEPRTPQLIRSVAFYQDPIQGNLGDDSTSHSSKGEYSHAEIGLREGFRPPSQGFGIAIERVDADDVFSCEMFLENQHEIIQGFVRGATIGSAFDDDGLVDGRYNRQDLGEIIALTLAVVIELVVGVI